MTEISRTDGGRALLRMSLTSAGASGLALAAAWMLGAAAPREALALGVGIAFLGSLVGIAVSLVGLSRGPQTFAGCVVAGLIARFLVTLAGALAVVTLLPAWRTPALVAAGVWQMALLGLDVAGLMRLGRSRAGVAG